MSDMRDIVARQGGHAHRIAGLASVDGSDPRRGPGRTARAAAQAHGADYHARTWTDPTSCPCVRRA